MKFLENKTLVFTPLLQKLSFNKIINETPELHKGFLKKWTRNDSMHFDHAWNYEFMEK